MEAASIFLKKQIMTEARRRNKSIPRELSTELWDIGVEGLCGYWGHSPLKRDETIQKTCVWKEDMGLNAFWDSGKTEERALRQTQSMSQL